MQGHPFAKLLLPSSFLFASFLFAACASSSSAGAPALAVRDEAPAAESQSSIASQVDIPFSKFVLPNGLTLIVHEDHKAPIVAVNVWYHIGSKNEKVGKTGFAHLFEHLMFQGTENLHG